MAERVYGPTVYPFEVLKVHKMPKVGNEYAKGTVISVGDERKVEVCYSKTYNPCSRCIRVECPFSQKEEFKV